jgi:hypothetical protein
VYVGAKLPTSSIIALLHISYFNHNKLLLTVDINPGYILKLSERRSIMAHTCNSSYLGGRDKRIEASPEKKKLAKPYLKEQTRCSDSLRTSRLKAQYPT